MKSFSQIAAELKAVYTDLENFAAQDKLDRIRHQVSELAKCYKPCSVCQHMYPEEAMKNATCAHCLENQFLLNLHEWEKASSELCYEIEKLPASTQQTEISIKASTLSRSISRAYRAIMYRETL